MAAARTTRRSATGMLAGGGAFIQKPFTPQELLRKVTQILLLGVWYNRLMAYPEQFIAPMRAELTSVGVKELRSAAEVDEAVKTPGTVMVVVNSICGCAAGKARPGIAMALRHGKRPDLVGTVFAGADFEATERAREHFAPYPPSSPSVALLRDGKLVWMLQRRDIETRDANAIAQQLTAAFDQFCGEAVGKS